jgi:hypothetical protein
MINVGCFLPVTGDRGMPDDDSDTPASKRPLTPLESIRLDKTAFSVVRLGDESGDREYWRAQSPLRRLEAVELMRQVLYGYDPISDRLERVLEVVKRQPR